MIVFIILWPVFMRGTDYIWIWGLWNEGWALNHGLFCGFLIGHWFQPTPHIETLGCLPIFALPLFLSCNIIQYIDLRWWKDWHGHWSREMWSYDLTAMTLSAFLYFCIWEFCTKFRGTEFIGKFNVIVLAQIIFLRYSIDVDNQFYWWKILMVVFSMYLWGGLKDRAWVLMVDNLAPQIIHSPLHHQHIFNLCIIVYILGNPWKTPTAVLPPNLLKLSLKKHCQRHNGPRVLSPWLE